MQRRLGREGRLRWFVEAAWPIIEPERAFRPGRHIDVVCEHLEALYNLEIDALAINIPPGHMKSLLCSVFFDAWVWIRDPAHKFLCGSFDLELPKRDGGKVLQIVRSDWFRERWGDIVQIVSPKNKKTEEKDPALERFYTSRGGLRLSVSPEGKGTGWHGNTVKVDDPVKAQDQSLAAMQKACNWITGTLATRKSDPQNFRKLLVMQRLHEKDPSAMAVKELGYHCLSLPWEYEPKFSKSTPVGGDWRTKPNEILWPEVHTEKTTADMKRDLKSPRNISAQMQQHPSPAEGIIFKKKHFEGQRFRELPQDQHYTWIQVWDLSFDDEGDDPDYVCGGVWALSRTGAYLYHREKAILDFPATLQTIVRVNKTYPQAATKGYVEKKANGAAVLKTIAKRFPGWLPVEPGHQSKTIRAHSVTHLFEAKNVYVRDEPWADDFENTLLGFPTLAHDDDVDMAVYALRIFEERAATVGEALAAASEAGIDVFELLG